MSEPPEPSNTPDDPPPPVEVAVAVIMNSEGSEPSILAAWRDNTKLRGGVWELPGGKVETGETLQQTAARETLEELGVRIAPHEVIAVSGDLDGTLPREQHVRVHAIRATLQGPEPDSTHRWRWIALSEIQDHPWPKANHQLNERLVTALGKMRSLKKDD